ncbi:hypothetical protein SISSUDRAFT_410551 [Sistotremastrum suecicum HHB10207 ss-3]|uniref:Uncharacterized protein n=1 Tax=Sistotremastrum suecicum HHB10207 ss-3 TaxID=1314776 RepID=A0A165YPB9_9AGAM|nr:hypothetical protein SISSUDRAFT_410551 [Sistotremastrum suecicum HHB10207 ss-3]
MWTKVIDKCVALGCSRFIVTNYYHWTYGSFTPDFRECIVSEAIPYDNIAPRIQEVNLFWMSRRFGIPQNYDTADSSTYVSPIPKHFTDDEAQCRTDEYPAMMAPWLPWGHQISFTLFTVS